MTKRVKRIKTAYGWVAGLSFLSLLIIAGNIEQGTIQLLTGTILKTICLILFGGSVELNNFLDREIKRRKRHRVQHMNETKTTTRQAA